MIEKAGKDFMLITSTSVPSIALHATRGRAPRAHELPRSAARTKERESTITCPECGAAKGEVMPTDACQFLYECSACGSVLRPREGHCCVFCSYGNVPCPPRQLERTGTTSRES